MTSEAHHSHLQAGMVLNWSAAARQNANFPKYVALVGQGPFSDYEVQAVSAKPPVYGDERFRDGMRVPEKLLDEEARANEARQIGDIQRIKIHVVDADKHHISAEFPAYFFEPARK